MCDGEGVVENEGEGGFLELKLAILTFLSLLNPSRSLALSRRLSRAECSLSGFGKGASSAWGNVYGLLVWRPSPWPPSLMMFGIEALLWGFTLL